MKKGIFILDLFGISNRTRFLLVVFLFGLLFPQLSISQYTSFKVYKPYTIGNFEPIELVQIDFRDQSTLLHFTLTNPSSLEQAFYIDRGFKLIDKETNKSYRLLNSYNLPLDNANELGCLENFGDKLNFTLEFEKVPDSLAYFDLIEKEDHDNAFNINEIVIFKDQVSDDYLDLNKFLSETPLHTTKYFYDNGEVFQYHSDPTGLIIAANVQLSKSYGKYYRINISIQNLTGETLNIMPEDIRAYAIKSYGEDNIEKIDVLSHEKYMKKVKNRQAWNSIAVGFSSGLAASSAGYSNSTTYSSGYSYDSYGTSYYSGTAYTTTYDGAAAYAAQRDAQNTIINFGNEQYEIKTILSEGYLKRNTLFNETEYIGYIHIPYSRKIKTLNVIFPINGREYRFVF